MMGTEDATMYGVTSNVWCVGALGGNFVRLDRCDRAIA